MTAEEILTGIEIEQATDVNSERTLFYFDEVIKAMKIYANQKLDEAAEICLDTKSDNREYFDNFPDTDWELDNNGHLFRGNKNGILALKDDI